MRYLLAVAVALGVLTGCSGELDSTGSRTGAPQGLGAFPSPAALARQAPKQSSGSYATLNRTLVHAGADYVPAPGWSDNAEVGGAGDAILHGTTAGLTYVLYQLNSTAVGNTDLISAISADVTWPTGSPAEPHGVYIGLPQHVDDRWVWIDAREVDGKWLDVSSHALYGLDPAGSVPSYIAFVNFSPADAHIHEIRLRFEAGSTLFGDEYVYYTSRAFGDPSLATSISRWSINGSTSELIHATDLATVIYGVPQVVDYLGVWQLFYSRHTIGNNSEIYYSQLDGSAPLQAGGEPGIDWYPGGWNYGDNHALIVKYDSSTFVGQLWASDANPPVPELGRLGRETDNYGEVVWDIAVDPATTEFAAIGSKEYDPLNNLYTIFRAAGNGPFPIDATPTALFTPQTDEDSRDPEMVELADFGGNPQYWVYFASKNRDDATYNLYRVLRNVPSEPEPVYVDPAYELRHPAISKNGRYLAFVRTPAGSSAFAAGELMIADLLNPGGATPAGPTDAVGFLSWYDPTP